MLEDVEFPPSFKSIAHGQIDNLPTQTSNAVRIFISSTFTDTVEERNKLTKEVFPDLRRYCQSRGVDFEVVDMRWGVRDTATSDHLTSELCLREIDHCKQLSLGPSFVAILGNKYGYRPIPASIPSDEYETLLDLITPQLSQEESRLMTDWFHKDSNAVPPVMPVHNLQPITANLKDYYNNSEPERRNQDRKRWWEIFKSLQRILRKAADYAVQEGVRSREEMHKYHFSVTEEEVRQATINGFDNCIFFLRDIQGIEDHLDNPMTPKMIDVTDDGVIDTEAQSHLQNLKTNTIGKENIHRFTIPWSPNGIDPSMPEHAQYLEEFCTTFKRLLKDMIDECLEKREKVQNPTVAQLYEEMLHQATFCTKKCSVTRGRQDVLRETSDYLAGHPGKPLIVHGVSGSGKTTVMAMIAKQARQWIGDSAVLVFRFLGTSAYSSSIQETLSSVCKQICYAYDVDQPSADILEDFTKLVQHFRHLLNTLPSSKKPLFLLLDSIDQLISQNDAHSVHWLPKNFPKDVHIAVSTLPNLFGILDKLKETLKDEECYFEMQPLPRDTGVEIVHGWLEEKHRNLTEQQKCPRPIFLKLLCEQCSKWRSYDDIDAGELPSDVRIAITDLFEDWERKHGPILVSHALGYLTAAKNGRTQMELEDVLSCDDEVLNDIYQYWDPPDESIVRIPGSLWKRIYYDIKESLTERQADGKTVIAWYHRQFWEAAQDRYLGSDAIKKKRNEVLARFFLGEFSEGTIRPITLHARGKTFNNADRKTSQQPLEFGNNVFNLRKLQELPQHLAVASMEDVLADQILFNFSWLLTKLRAFSFLELMSDFQNTSEEIDLLYEMMYLASSNLKADPFTLAGQLIGRLSDHRTKYQKIDRLLQQAMEWVVNSNMSMMMPRSTCLMPPGGPLRVTLAGHPTRVLKVACTKSGKFLVSACEDSTGHIMANIWDLATSELVQTLQMKNSVPKLNGHLAMAISDDDCYVILGHRSLGIFNLSNGDCVKQLQVDNSDSVILTDLKSSEHLIIAGSMEGNQVYVWNLNDGSSVLQLELPGTSTVPFVFLRNKCSQLVAMRADSTQHIVDLGTGQVIWECLSLQSDSYQVTSSILSPDEQDLIAGCSDGAIRVWQLEQISTEPKSILTGHKKPVTKLLINSRNQLISGSLDATVRVWGLSNGHLMHTLVGHDGAITCLAFVPDDDTTDALVVSGSKDDKLKVWNAATGSLVNTLEGHSSWISDVTAVNLGNQGVRVISACNDKTVKLWMPAQLMTSHLSRHDTSPRCIAVSPSSRYLTTSATKGITKVWNTENGKCLQDIQVECKALTAIPGIEDHVIGGDIHGNLHCWNLVNGEEVWSVSAAHDNSILHLCWSSSTELISAGGSKAKMWNVDLKESVASSPKAVFAGHDDELTAIAVTKESRLVVTVCKKGVVKIWAYDGGVCYQTLSLDDKVECLAVSSNDRFLAAGTRNGKVAVWSLESMDLGRKIASSELSKPDSVVCLVFTEDEKHLICGMHTAKKQLHMWDFQSDGDGSSRFLEGHHHAVMVTKLLANGEYLLTSSRDCTLKIWHVATGQLVTTFDCQSQIKLCDFVEIGDRHWLIAAATKMAIVFVDAKVLPDGVHARLIERNGRTVTGVEASTSVPRQESVKTHNHASNGESGRSISTFRSKFCGLL